METNALIDALVTRLQGQSAGPQMRTKAVGSTPTALYPHGTGGLFSYPGLSQPLVSALLLPASGLQSRLPLFKSNELNPLMGIITGVTATTGSEPTGVCDDPPVAGSMKLCTTSLVFGRFSRQTPVYDLDRAGLVTNRGEFTDLIMVNNPLDLESATTPTIPGMNGNDAVRTMVGKAVFELGVAWSRDFAQLLYTGNPTNNTAGGGYQEFRGLDNLINTGYRDAITGNACAAADSLIVSFNNQNVASAGSVLYNTLTYTYRNLKYIASRTGMAPVKWVITMPWMLFYEVANIWACAYSSMRCNTNNLGSGSTQFIDGRDVIALRDSMLGDNFNRTGQYLLIDGERVEVITDDAITETDLGGGTFSSSIYFVPLSGKGGAQALTYMDYVPYDMPGGALEAARSFAGVTGGNPAFFQATDNGRFLWHFKPPTNFCVQMLAKTQPRLVLRTPYLAARVTNVRYTPYMTTRSWDPDAGPSLYVNGGRTNYTGYGPSFFSPTA